MRPLIRREITKKGQPDWLPFFTVNSLTKNYQRLRPPPPPPSRLPRPPPRLPPPPPKLSRFAIGLASLTVSVRPSSCVPFRLSMAFWASPLELISTKPKPRDCPVNLSEITLADSTVPCSAKISCNRSPVTEYGNPPTYNLLPMFSSY